ncbi:hypothetical protein C6N40_13700 [Arenimonas caeni]|uniref:Uncharacterized protein n=1 Tax=Arenimonas caeni TaxID=2058085 RepID=A0A2P6M5Q4_9GAMM|nr:hypothetical protein C6N40_13700 [Arenimonas caeni]
MFHRRWEGALASVYLYLADRPPHGIRAFRRALAFVARNRSQWVEIAAGRKDWSDIATRGKTGGFSLATALFSLSPVRDIDLQRTLAWLILELRLTGWSDEELEPVCSWLRGLSSDDHKLRDAIGGCNGLRSLRERIDYLQTRSSDPRVITGHGDFDLAWDKWLEAVVSRLLRPLKTNAEWGESRPRPLDGPDTDPPDPLLEDPSEPDMVSGWELDAVEGAGEGHGLRNRLAAAIGKEIHRRSSPELLRDPDNILPRPVARQAWERTVGLIQSGLDANDLPLAEQGLDHLLGIEVGLSRVEAEATAFGDGEAVTGPIIDLTVGALRRPESRPRGAYSPKPDAFCFWQSTGGDILFPLSAMAISLAQRLLALRAKSDSHQDTGLLLTEVVSPKDRKAWLASTEVRQTLDVLEPIKSATRPVYRLRLAAELAGRLGQDAAQIAFGDTFGASAAPTYYGAFPAEALAYQAALANVGLQGRDSPTGAKAYAGEPDARDIGTLLTPEVRAQCAHMVGSRVRPHRAAFEGAWEAVGVSSEPRRGRPKVMRAVDDWRRQRDSLALHLMLATGHRPFMALGTIHLTDFLPAKAMALIRDKRSDPARLTRLVGTGWKFVGALESFVEDLRRLAKDLQADDAARNLARKILRGAEPVFSLPAPDGSIEALDVSQLLARLPPVWAERPNLHRHALDQALIRAGLDPEHRYFQMGWLEGEVHAVSDMAPYPADVLGAILAGPIDAWLESVGWLGGHPPKDPDSILADIPLRDFDQAAQAHRADYERRIHELKRALNERRREITPVVQRELIKGLERLPTSNVLVPFLSKGNHGELRLRLKDPAAERPRITPDMVDAVLAPLRSNRYEPVHAYVGARILSAALLWACKRRQCSASLPPLQQPSFKSVPSPFVPGIGLASAVADELRATLVSAASNTKEPKDGATWRAHLGIWAILAHTPYRSLKQARLIALGLEDAKHSQANGWLLRVPLGDGHVPITGPAAPLLHRLRQESGWRDLVDRVCGDGSAELGRFLKTILPGRIPAGVSETKLRDWMIATLRTAGAAQLTGPERLVMNGVVQPASVRADRIAAAEDGASLPGLEDPDALLDSSSETEKNGRRSRKTPEPTGDEKVRRLMKCFHADYRGAIAGEPALPPKGRIKQLLPEVKRVLGELGRTPTLPRMTLEYVKKLMVKGGPRSKGGMKLRSIYRIYHSIAPSLAAVPATVDLRDVGEETLTNALLASIVLSKNKDKPDVLDEVRRFVEFVEEDHDIPTPNWDLVYLNAGEAIRGKDPAIVTDAEVSDILQVLASNVSPEAMAGIDPVEHRARELAFGSALLLEASNARPQSIYGLTLADIHLGPGGDFIQLRTAGKYAEVKTPTSAGFIPLDGEVWQGHRRWFVEWIQGLRRTRPQEDWIHIPLFATPDGPVGDRFPRRLFLDRLGELIRWRTRQSRGRTYWLRKRGVRNRHDQVRRARNPKARDVYRVLKVCGHSTIVTPIASYIGDPSAWMDLDTPVKAAAERGAASALSGLPAATLDQRWQRWRHASKASDGPDEKTRLALMLHMPDPKWPRLELPDPPPYKSTLTGFSLQAVESVMNAFSMGCSPEEVVEIIDVDVGTVGAIHTRCQELTRRTGLLFSKDSLRRPRRTPAYLGLMAELRSETRGLGVLAREWVSCARIKVPRGSIALIEPAAVAQLRAWAERIGYELASGSNARGDVGYCLAQKGEGAYGSEPVLEWILAVLWVAAGLAVCRDLKLLG